MEIYEVKQKSALAKSSNEWMVLGTYQHRHLAIEFAERLINDGIAKREDIEITLTTTVNVEWSS